MYVFPAVRVVINSGMSNSNRVPIKHETLALRWHNVGPLCQFDPHIPLSASLFISYQLTACLTPFYVNYIRVFMLLQK